jgi:hypothetical protein
VVSIIIFYNMFQKNDVLNLQYSHESSELDLIILRKFDAFVPYFIE